MLKRVLLAVALGVTMSACAGAPGAVPATGRVTGHVTSRACGGAAQENQAACRFHPAPGVALAFKQAASGDISFATANASGAYAITLPPGDYVVTYKNPASLGPISGSGGSRRVTVNAGKTVVADFSYTLQLL
jgi:hypothetical protein